jgi:hypothetical protein
MEAFYASHAGEGNEIVHHYTSTSVDTIRGHTTPLGVSTAPPHPSLRTSTKDRQWIFLINLD